MPRRPRRPLLVMTVGVPGSGKSFFAARCAAALGAALVVNDEVRRALVGRPTYGPDESADVERASFTQVAGALRVGRDVVYDATNLRPEARERLAARTNGLARLVPVVLTADAAVLKARLDHREGERPYQGVVCGARADGRTWWDVSRELAGAAGPPPSPALLVDSTGDIDLAIRWLGDLARH